MEIRVYRRVTSPQDSRVRSVNADRCGQSIFFSSVCDIQVKVPFLKFNSCAYSQPQAVAVSESERL